MRERKPTREICSLCHEVSRVGFHVPNEVWELSVHPSQVNDIICLACFTRQADERGVQWDREIAFYPVSWVTHTEEYARGYREAYRQGREAAMDGGTERDNPFTEDPDLARHWLDGFEDERSLRERAAPEPETEV